MTNRTAATRAWSRDRRFTTFLRGPGAVGEFLRALRDPFTYRIDRNPFLVFGFLWGIPIPVVSIGVHLVASELDWRFRDVFDLIAAHPFHLAFLVHPFLFGLVFGAIGSVVRQRERRIARLVAHLESKADTDGLTGLYNHRAFQTLVRSEATRVEEIGQPIALIMMDLDHFKQFNDRYGHPAGDDLLRALASRIKNVVREGDLACRYGGEEFAVILPAASVDEAASVAERLRQHLSSEEFHLREIEGSVRVTLSCGVSGRRTGEPVGDWIARTDRLLYQAKGAGRDQVRREEPS